MDWAAIIWAVLLVGFVIAEAACPIHLISLWFAAGALVATVASLLGAAVWLQIVLFLSVSGILLAAGDPKVFESCPYSHQCGCHDRNRRLYHCRCR